MNLLADQEAREICEDLNKLSKEQLKQLVLILKKDPDFSEIVKLIEIRIGLMAVTK